MQRRRVLAFVGVALTSAACSSAALAAELPKPNPHREAFVGENQAADLHAGA